MPDERRTFTLYPHPPLSRPLSDLQERVLNCVAPRIVMIAPPGSGATLCGILWSLRAMLEHRSGRCLVAAASWPHVEQCILPNLLRCLDDLGDGDITFADDRRSIISVDGPQIDLYGADPRSRPIGPDIDWLYIDALDEWTDESRRLIDDLLYRSPQHVLITTHSPGRWWSKWGPEWRRDTVAIFNADDYLPSPPLATQTLTTPILAQQLADERDAHASTTTQYHDLHEQMVELVRGEAQLKQQILELKAKLYDLTQPA